MAEDSAMKMSSVMFLDLKRWQQIAAQALRRWPGFQSLSREPKAWETYLGSWGLVVVLRTKPFRNHELLDAIQRDCANRTFLLQRTSRFVPTCNCRSHE